MNNSELLDQLTQQTDINTVLLLTMAGLQNDIIQAQQSAAVSVPETLNTLHTAWNRIKLALIERERILNDKDETERDITTDLNQDKEAA